MSFSMDMKTYTYKYPRPSVTVDLVILKEEQLLLIQRANDPCQGQWALPGGFVDENEDLEIAARRELLEETGLVVGTLEQQGAFGKLGRDPRGHTISIAYRGKIEDDKNLEAADDAADARWFAINNLPELAFDHAEIIAQVLT